MLVLSIDFLAACFEMHVWQDMWIAASFAALQRNPLYPLWSRALMGGLWRARLQTLGLSLARSDLSSDCCASAAVQFLGTKTLQT